jgi:hypothetical protein
VNYHQAVQTTQVQVGPQVQSALPAPSPVPSLPQEHGLQEQCSPQVHIVCATAAGFTGAAPPLLGFPAHLPKQKRKTAARQIYQNGRN